MPSLQPDFGKNIWRYTFTKEQVERLRRLHNVTPNGVVFEDELTSINGCTFFVIKEEGVTMKMIAEAKRWLRSQRDVVGMHIAYVSG